jgi:protein-S-isoprenylcysteine O-methyltransferase Ste14
MRVFGRSATLMTALGGVAFASSIGYCAWSYFVTWRVPRAGRLSIAHLGVDTLLFAIFAAHHSVTARPTVKAQIARAVGESSVRTVYVWLASALLGMACAAWQPVGGLVYQLQGARAAVFGAIQIAGICLFVLSVRWLDPLELAGFDAISPAVLHDDGPYGWVRHPLYTAWMLITFVTPTMTADRLLFAIISSAYLCVAIPWEETLLRRLFGEAYADYAGRVRWRVVPFLY